MTDGKDIQYDVKVTNASKSFGGNNVLDGIVMNVESGSIYGLLGPSGCGKSTLLQCILGIIPLDSGCIDLKAENLKDIGYMPQDLCMEETLTVREMFEYYGTLYKMSKKNIESRVAELDKFLQLPDMNSYIKSLSGGQGRRVSFAISLLHDPKIIILDEPTVGIDPLLRHNIWMELKKMAEQRNKTIIITTHYIEEANQASCIGLLRNGKIIEEGPPLDILSKHNTDTLEEAFLTLCCKQGTQNKTVIDEDEDRVKYKTQSKQSTRFGKDSIDRYRIKALMKKNLYVFLRDYTLLFTMLVLPISQSFFYCFGVGTNIKNMPIAIKNDEVNVTGCHVKSSVDGCIFDQYSNQTMSCVFINYLLSRGYKLVEVKDRETGEMSMTDPSYMAFIYFQKNFTKELSKYIDDRENFDKNSGIYIHITKDNLVFRSQMRADLFKSLNSLIDKTLTGCSNNPKSIRIPLDFNTIYGQRVTSFLNSTITLFIAMVVFYFPNMFSITMMMSEKFDGVLSRSMFAGVKLSELLISLFCINTVLVIAQMFASCLISYAIFSNPIEITSGLFVYFLLLLFLGWIGFLFGIFFAVVSPSKLLGNYLVIGWCLTQVFSSGMAWPVEGQSKFLKMASEMLPIRLAGNTMNNIVLKGWTWNHPSTIWGTGFTFVYILALVFILFCLRKFRKDWWVIHR